MVMHVELQATCTALGYQEGEQYVKEPDCLETVKDLIRYLKREDDTCDIRRQLGHAQIVQNDLLPLVKQYHKDRTLFETLIRLLVNLTQPAILCFGNQVPTDKLLHNHYLETQADLQSYKEAFVDEELFSVLTEKLGELLKLDWENRQEEDKMLIERILILIRNVLHVPPNQGLEQRTDDDASVHDQVIWALHCSGLEDLLLYVASSDEERHLALHVVEIISLMFREQTPDMLVSAGVNRSLSEKQKDERELEMIREQEKVQKKANFMKFSTRHSRFGGTYVVKNMKSISERDVIFHKAQHDVNAISFDKQKKRKKIPQNRQPIIDKELHRRSTLSIRLGLKEFCVQFLESCYNPLMYAVKDILNRQKTQEHDETYYLWGMRFFMEFCRLHSKQVELVSETMSVATFHFIQVQMYTYYEMQMMEKKEAVVWGKRVHLALKAYQELLLTLDSMDRSKNPQLVESSKVIKSNIFYMMEFRDIYLTLLKKFDQSRQSREYLKDLIETTHLFLKMLESTTKKNSHFVVQKKKKGSRKKQKAKENIQPAEHSEQELEDMWDGVSGELSAILQGRGEIPQDVSPFDAASEVQEEQQRIDAMIMIQDAMRDKESGRAIALLRSAREIWPERDEFGSQDISAEDEFMAMREIFLANLPRQQASEAPQNPIEEYEEGAPEEEEEAASVVSEQEFNLLEYVNKFCKPDVLKNYVLLLADFQKNTTHTNHCVLKMLHRVSVDLKYPGMMFQASLFRVFQKVILSPLAKVERYKELTKFGTYIIRHFVECAENNPKIFMEFLFWKSNKEASELMEGYGTYNSKAKVLWTEEQEMEVRRLYEEYQDHEEDDKDVVDCMMEHITDPTKTRGQIIREMKKQGLIGSAKDIKKPKKGGGLSRMWTEEQEYELRDLFEQHRSSNDVLGNILTNLVVKRSKNKVIEKLLDLGLVNDRKELYKRRSQKSRRGGDGSDDELDDIREERQEFQELPSDFEDHVSSSDEGDKSGSESNDEDGEDEQGHGESSSYGDGDTMDVIINNIVDKGYKDQLSWIRRSVKRTLDDRENNGNEVPVPIVPLTEENETAMEDQMFLSFLKKIGISPPANEQEAFWRIPGNLRPDDLRNIFEGLELDEEGNAANANKIKVCEVKTTQKGKMKEKKKKKPKEKKGKTSDRMNKLKAMIKQRKQEKEGKASRRDRKKRQQSNENDEDAAQPATAADDEVDGSVAMDTEDVRIPTPPSKKKSRIKRVIQSDSDSDEEMSPLRIDLGSDENQAEEESQKQPLALGDSSDEETTNTQQSSQNTSQSQKRPLSFNDSSDNEDDEVSKKPNKRARIQDSSDSDSDDDVPLSSAVRKPLADSDANTPQSSNKHLDDSDDDVPLLSATKKDSDSSYSDGDVPLSSATKKTKKDSDSSDSDDNVPLSSATKKPNKDPNISDSDDDVPLSSATKKPKKDSDSSDSDNDVPLKKQSASFPATLYTQQDSDSELDDHVPLRKVIQKKNVIESDEDD